MRFYIKCMLFMIIILCFFSMNSYAYQSEIELVEDSLFHCFSYDLIHPNPMAQTSGIFTYFTIPETCMVSISILDTTLNTIYEFKAKQMAPGRYIVRWNFRNNSGDTVSSGLYYMDLLAEGASNKNLNRYSCRQKIVVIP